MSRVEEVQLATGAKPVKCRYCGKLVFFAHLVGSDPQRKVCLDAGPPVYLLEPGPRATRKKAALVGHHATCTKFHEAQKQGKLIASGDEESE